MNDLKRVALVTGAGSGIGLAVAESLCKSGFMTVLLGRSENVQRAAERLGRNAASLLIDLGKEEQLLEAASFMRKTYGRCDVLVNNAGINPKKDGNKYRTED